MKALIDDNLSPIKPDPDDNNGDFRLKVQPIVKDNALRKSMKTASDSIDADYEFPTP